MILTSDIFCFLFFSGISCGDAAYLYQCLTQQRFFQLRRGVRDHGRHNRRRPPERPDFLSAYGLGKLDSSLLAGTVSKHLEDCDSCQCRVAELSSDEFLGRLRNAQLKNPDKSAADWSPSFGVSATEVARGPVAPLPLRSTHFLPSWSTTPTTRSSASRDAAGWVWSTCSFGTNSWGVSKCSRSSAGTWSSGPACATGSSARSSRPPNCNTRISSLPTRPSDSARALFLPWSLSTGKTWRRW